MRKLSVLPNAEVTVTYKGTGRFKEQVFMFSDYRIKGAKAGGVLITKRDVASIRIKPAKLIVQEEQAEESVEVRDENEGPGLFD